MSSQEVSASTNHQATVNVTSALEEALPHVTKKICAIWGNPGFEPFVQELLMDSRDGERKGIPWTAAQDLLFLNEISVAKRAMVAAEVTGIPYRQVFKDMMANMEAAQNNAAQAWSNPSLNKDARSTDAFPGNMQKSAGQQHTGVVHQAAQQTPSNRAHRRKKSWWQKLFG